MLYDHTPQQFLAGLRANMTSKDLEAMWPVGLISTSSLFGNTVAVLMDEALKVAGSRGSRPTDAATFPTSYLVTLAVCVLGIIRAGWTKRRIIEFIGRYLAYAQAGKPGSLLNVGGANILFDDEEASHVWAGIQSSDHSSCREVETANQLSAMILAIAEATFFQFHRVVTEKHGPYLSRDVRGCLLIRSVSTLTTPSRLWPELCLPAELLELDDLHLVWRLRSSDYRFDGFSNLIHLKNARTDAVAVAIYDRSTARVSALDGRMLGRFSNYMKAGQRYLADALGTLDALGLIALRERLIGSLLFANRCLLEQGDLDWSLALEMVMRNGDRDSPDSVRATDARGIVRELEDLIGD